MRGVLGVTTAYISEIQNHPGRLPITANAHRSGIEITVQTFPLATVDACDALSELRTSVRAADQTRNQPGCVAILQ